MYLNFELKSLYEGFIKKCNGSDYTVFQNMRTHQTAVEIWSESTHVIELLYNIYIIK